MYTLISLEEARSDKYKNYKLAYVDDIPPTEYRATPETEAYFKSEEYTRNLDMYGYCRNDPKIKFGVFPNPNYVKGEREKYAYFCDVENMGQVWGDDMDDTPYEYNSGIPYDIVYDKRTGKETKIEVLYVPFGFTEEAKESLKEPKDYTFDGSNSHWCTEDINLGAVPWLFWRSGKPKGENIGVSIIAGISPLEFAEKIEKINELSKSI